MSAETTAVAADKDMAELAETVARIAAGETDLAVVAGVTDEELEAIYSVGHGLYASGKYNDALDFFRVLCICRQIEPRYWFAFGATNQLLGDHGNALRAYGMAALYDTENAQISLRAAECLIKLGDFATARDALEAVELLAEGNPANAAYAERARLMLRAIDAESGS